MRVSRPKFLCVLVALCSLGGTDRVPGVDVDYHSNLHLWRAQKNILTAFENLEQADRESARMLGAHGDKARELLVQAAKEVKLASSPLGRKR